jgi:hypothetical protein
MRGTRSELSNLLSAFDLLLVSSRPRLAVPVLRRAIAELADTVEAPRLRRALATPRYNGAAHHKSDGAATDWETLRPRLHAIVAGSDPAERAQIAAQLGVSPTTLRNLTSTTPPGKAVAARAAQWLAARQAGAVSTDEETAPAEPETVNGADSAAACHLTSQMCDQFNFLIQTDPSAVRQSGVRLETARHAALGGAVEPPIAERLIKFLENG